MCILHTRDDNGGHPGPVEATIGFSRSCLQWDKTEPVRVTKIDGKLAGTVAMQLVAAGAGQMAYLFQRLSGMEFIQPATEQLGAAVTVAAAEQLGVVHIFSKLLIVELYVHMLSSLK